MFNKTIFLFLTLIAVSRIVVADPISAITTEGKRAILNDDGTWKYAEAAIHDKKPAAQKFAKSAKTPYGVWYDPTIWTKLTQSLNEDAEISFSMKGKDVYAMFISEEIAIPLDTMREVLIEHLESVADNVVVNEEDERQVNGLPVKYMQIDADIQNLPFSYMIYIHTGEEETVQIYTFTFRKLLEQQRAAMEEFLNGLAKDK
ncbi:MAG: hypothetical protein H7A37_04450 [Chlamydiales bacterium]|nr:hypothetical protein [Chlamydiia bacterium]MCP5507534.1 hypothetical protein [Chlamydiales bacterium]